MEWNGMGSFPESLFRSFFVYRRVTSLSPIRVVRTRDTHTAAATDTPVVVSSLNTSLVHISSLGVRGTAPLCLCARSDVKRASVASTAVVVFEGCKKVCVCVEQRSQHSPHGRTNPFERQHPMVGDKRVGKPQPIASALHQHRPHKRAKQNAIMPARNIFLFSIYQ